MFSDARPRRELLPSRLETQMAALSRIPASGARRRFRVLTRAVVTWGAFWAAAGLLMAVWAAGPAEAGESNPPARRVRLVIDYGDGVQKHFTALAWREGMTVLDALKEAQKHPRGITCTFRGRGATAFLTKIDDLENEGRGRNWTYRINGKLADRSFALAKLKPADTVLWEFGRYR